MSKKTIKIFLALILISGGIFLISRFVGETLPGVTVTQTEFDLSGVVPEGLVGYWTFDGDDMNWASTTAEALDRSGNNYNGNVTNFGSEGARIGKIGQALDFDGSNDYVDLGSGVTSALNGNFTIALWFRADSLGDGRDVLFGKNGTSHSRQIALDWQTASRITFGQENVAYIVTNNNNLSTGKWYHVVWTHAGGSHVLYLDGVQDNTASHTFTSSYSGDYWMGNSDSNTHDGLIDEVRVYNRAITAAEVSELYNATKKVTISPSPKDTLRSGLVGYWTFDGDDMNWASTTAEALDRSGNGNNGDVTNFGQGSVRPGKIGQALSFDGVNDDIRVPDASSLDITSAISVFAWVKSSNFVDFGRILSKGDTYGAYSIDIDSSDKIHTSFAGLTPAEFNGTNVVPLNAWVHVGFTYDGSNHTTYINGAQDLQTSTSGTIGTNNTAISIGARNAGSSSFFSGQIDEVRVYNRALSAAEVSELYGATKRAVIEPAQTHLVPNGLDLYLSFNGSDMNWASTTAEALDRSGNNRHSDVTNFGIGGAIIGKVGQALTFDGSDDYVLVPSFSMSTDASIAAWVKLDAQTEGYEMYFEYKRFGGGWYYLSAQQNCCGDARNWEINGVQSNMSPDLGKWYHVVMTVNGTTQKIYVDGALDKESTITARTSTTDTPRIGGNQSGGEDWNGQIDEVRVYNRTLTAAEVLELYQGR